MNPFKNIGQDLENKKPNCWGAVAYLLSILAILLIFGWLGGWN